MGVPGLFGSFITRAAKQAIIKHGQITNIDSVSIDVNGILHRIFQLVYTIDIHEQIKQLIKDEKIAESEQLKSQYEEGVKLIAEGNQYGEQYKIRMGNDMVNQRFLMKKNNLSDDAIQVLNNNYKQKLWELILNIIKEFGNIHTLILAVDSVSNAAKMKQQRQRRFKSALRTDLSVYFDSNMITPATEFMIMVDTFLREQITLQRHLLPERVIYSSHLSREGEGEHRIMQYFRDGVMNDLQGYHVVYGLDADLIMLSLLSPQQHIILSRESQEDMIHIDTLKNYLVQRMRSGTAIQDFIILMFLLGNDFLPHHVALETSAETIDLLLNLYTQGGHYRFTTPQGSINMASLLIYLKQLANQEPHLLRALSRRDDFSTTPLKLATQYNTFNINTYRDAYYRKALSEPTDRAIEKMVKSYVKMMFWNYHYYTVGHAGVNQEFYYRDHAAPMLVDLAIYAENLHIQGYTSYPGMLTINPLHQLVSVLPKQSINLIPPELRWLFTINSPLYDLFPTTFVNDNEGKIHKKMAGRPTMDHGIALIPIPDRQRIIDTMAIVAMDMSPWDKQEDLVSVVVRPRPKQRFNQPVAARQPRFTPRETFNVQAEEFIPQWPQPRTQCQRQFNVQAKEYVPRQQLSYQPVVKQPTYQPVVKQPTYQPVVQQPYQPVVNQNQPVVKTNLPAMINMEIMKTYITIGELPKTAQQQLLEQPWY